MFVPRKYKYTKVHKKKTTLTNSVILNGHKNLLLTYNLVSKDYGSVQAYTLELIRRYLVRSLSRKGTISCVVSTPFPKTKKSSKARMGKGYGKLHKWVGYIKPGDSIFRMQIHSLSQLNNLQKKIRFLNKKLRFRCYVYYYDYRLYMHQISKNFLKTLYITSPTNLKFGEKESTTIFLK